jgi:hypothetical protein
MLGQPFGGSLIVAQNAIQMPVIKGVINIVFKR